MKPVLRNLAIDYLKKNAIFDGSDNPIHFISKKYSKLGDDKSEMVGLNKNYVKNLIESAIALEKIDIAKAFYIMKLASEANPNGPYIKKKLEQYKKQL